jgi:hypothetical protein
MAEQDHILNPGKELERVNFSIARYEMLAKTSTNPDQQKRILRKLNELKKYRERIELLFQVTDDSESFDETEEPVVEAKFASLLFSEDTEENAYDEEIHKLNMYMEFFYAEFLSFFSERKLKLDFKYSIDRDSAHHKFMEIKRRVEDYEKESSTMREGNFQKDLEKEIKLRNMKLKRSLCIEANKFLLWVREFASVLIGDLQTDGLLCLNGDDIISFELDFDKHYCEGLTVKQALVELVSFTDEVIEYLNIPDIEARL